MGCANLAWGCADVLWGDVLYVRVPGMGAAMTRIELQDGAIQIDADIIGRGLGLEAETVRTLMRERKITSLCERGEKEDAGRYRLTFFHAGKRFRLVIDATGGIVQSSTVDFGDRPLPASMRKPGA